MKNGDATPRLFSWLSFQPAFLLTYQFRLLKSALLTKLRRCKKAKALRCRDVGMDCDFLAHAGPQEEVLKKAAEHAVTAHDMKEIPEEVFARVRAAISDK